MKLNSVLSTIGINGYGKYFAYRSSEDVSWKEYFDLFSDAVKDGDSAATIGDVAEESGWTDAELLTPGVNASRYLHNE